MAEVGRMFFGGNCSRALKCLHTVTINHEILRLFSTSVTTCGRNFNKGQQSRITDVAAELQKHKDRHKEEVDNFFSNPGEMRRRHQRQIFLRKYKTIERKYFKHPRSETLLTWAAMEQMRYLNKHYAEEWDIDMLLATFPVTPKDLVKILKSKLLFQQSPAHVMKHDEKVRKRWRKLLCEVDPDQLTDDPEVEETPLVRSARLLVESGAIENMANATGCKDAPFPKMVTGQDLIQTPVGKFTVLAVNHKRMHQIEAPDLAMITGGDNNALTTSHHRAPPTAGHMITGGDNNTLTTPHHWAPPTAGHMIPRPDANNIENTYSESKPDDDDILLEKIMKKFCKDVDDVSFAVPGDTVLQEDSNEDMSVIPEETIDVSRHNIGDDGLIRKGRHLYTSDGDYLYSMP